MPVAVLCHDCKTEYYLGYGGENHRRYCLLKFPIEQHSGHKLEQHCDEYTRVVCGDLYVDGAGWEDDTLWVEKYSEWKHVDLCDTHPVCARLLPNALHW